jgi:hypothetical protein
VRPAGMSGSCAPLSGSGSGLRSSRTHGRCGADLAGQPGGRSWLDRATRSWRPERAAVERRALRCSGGARRARPALDVARRRQVDQAVPTARSRCDLTDVGVSVTERTRTQVRRTGRACAASTRPDGRRARHGGGVRWERHRRAAGPVGSRRRKGLSATVGIPRAVGDRRAGPERAHPARGTGVRVRRHRHHCGGCRSCLEQVPAAWVPAPSRRAGCTPVQGCWRVGQLPGAVLRSGDHRP